MPSDVVDDQAWGDWIAPILVDSFKRASELTLLQIRRLDEQTLVVLFNAPWSEDTMGLKLSEGAVIMDRTGMRENIPLGPRDAVAVQLELFDQVIREPKRESDLPPPDDAGVVWLRLEVK